MTRKKKRDYENTLEGNPPPQPTTEAAGASLQDDSLAETRRALIEEQNQAEEHVGIIKKVTRRLKANKAIRGESKATDSVPASEEIELGKRLEEVEAENEIAPTSEDVALEAETQSILEALEKAESACQSAGEAEAIPVSEAGAVSTSESPALAQKSPVGEDQGYRAVRDIALSGYEEPAPEALAPPQTSIYDQIDDLAGRVKYKTLMRITIISLTAVVCLTTFLIASWVWDIQSPASLRAEAVPTIRPTLPPAYPIQIRLPGGWMFVLSQGSITNGKWEPAQAEWLEGTEICRWVSLPYGKQLEAVFRTLKPGDRIDLVMSNYDRWSYRVRSVTDIQAFELSDMDKNYPSLLLILTNPDSDSRLVVLAVP